MKVLSEPSAQDADSPSEETSPQGIEDILSHLLGSFLGGEGAAEEAKGEDALQTLLGGLGPQGMGALEEIMGIVRKQRAKAETEVSSDSIAGEVVQKLGLSPAMAKKVVTFVLDRLLPVLGGAKPAATPSRRATASKKATSSQRGATQRPSRTASAQRSTAKTSSRAKSVKSASKQASGSATSARKRSTRQTGSGRTAAPAARRTTSKTAGEKRTTRSVKAAAK